MKPSPLLTRHKTFTFITLITKNTSQPPSPSSSLPPARPFPGSPHHFIIFPTPPSPPPVTTSDHLVCSQPPSTLRSPPQRRGTGVTVCLLRPRQRSTNVQSTLSSPDSPKPSVLAKRTLPQASAAHEADHGSPSTA
ncbi:hypothetical protein E2C01_092310 [Portunus trituberculatus]|uniref:Uncharacterized protein n=1 Tax=Portunus trituberculatus TaxID=210409 RepID=A0A5B7JLF1_PORTR|nr:hypothetical protein [Portunus trituberculatus]